MFKSSITIFIILQIANQASGNIDTVKTPLDSIYISGYKAVYYRLSSKDTKPEYEWDIYSCDSLILNSDKSSLGVKLYNFCKTPSGPRITCNFQDIDNDGHGEIIFEIPRENSARGEKVSVYTPDLLNPVGAVFDGREKGFGKLTFKDIDKDGTFEVLFRDLNFRSWHSSNSNSPEPYLVWKLFGKQYKLANFYLYIDVMNNLYNINTPITDKLPNMVYFGPPNADSIVSVIGKVNHYNPNDDATYPIKLANTIVILTYTSYVGPARILFDKAWPDSVANKEIFWTELQDKIKSDPIWKDVQQSGLAENKKFW